MAAVTLPERTLPWAPTMVSAFRACSLALAALLVVSASGCAAGSGATFDLEEAALPGDGDGDGETLETSEAAATEADGHGLWKAFTYGAGVTMVEPLGPPSGGCLRPTGYPGCPVARLDFREVRLSRDAISAVLDRVRQSSDDEARTSVLFKGRAVRVTVNDHKTGSTTTEWRFLVSAVYMAPTARPHASTYHYLYVSGGQQYAFQTAIEPTTFPAPTKMVWSGVPSPGALVDDAVVTGSPGPLTQPGSLVADQIFTRLR